MAVRDSFAAVATVCFLGVASGCTNLRLGSLQIEDFVLLLLFTFCIGKFIGSAFSLHISAEVNGLLKAYSLLLFALLITAILALRLRFYPLDEASLLKQPVIFSFSRLLQFVAIICGFLWLTNAFVRKKALLFLALRAYWWTGIVCSWYAIVSYCAVAALHFSAPDLFGAYSNLDGGVRARGLFNEGGPFGIYVVSVFVAGLLRRKTTGRSLGVINVTALMTALLLSGSKAAFLVVASLAMFSIVSAASFRTRVYYLIVAVAIGWGAWVWLGLGNQLGAYLYSYLNMGDEIAARGNDYNLVVGRLSALHIVPKMILAHPVTGIGLGNYPLMRNDPAYLDGLPAITEIEDLPALGIPGIAAEMGIPLTICVLILLLFPYFKSRRQNPIFAMVALFQPIAHTFGVQLNFFYPWFVTACVLGAAYQCEQFGPKLLVRSQGPTPLAAPVPSRLGALS